MFDTVEKHRGLFKILLALIALSFVTFTAHSFSSASDNYIVKVGNQTVTEQDIERFIRLRNLPNNDETRQQVAEALIQQAYLVSGAKELGLDMTTGQIKKLITQIPIFQENGQFVQAKFDEYLQKIHQPEAVFIENLRTDYFTQTMNALIGAPAPVADAQTQVALKIFSNVRQAQMLGFSPADYENKVKINDADLEAFYNKNQAQYNLPPAVQFNFVRVSIQDLLPHQTVSDEEIQAAIQAGTPETEAKQNLQLEKANRAFALLKENLAEVAFNQNENLNATAQAAKAEVQKYSEWLTKEAATQQFPAPVVEALFSDDVMKKGNNSDVIDDGQGSLWVLRTTQTREAKTQSFADVKNLIQKQYLQEETRRLAQNDAKAMFDKLQKGEKINAKWSPQDEMTLAQAKMVLSPEAYQQFLQAAPKENAPVYVLSEHSPVPAVIRVNAIVERPVSPELQNITQQQLTQKIAQDHMQDYMNYLKRTIKSKQGSQKIAQQS